MMSQEMIDDRLTVLETALEEALLLVRETPRTGLNAPKWLDTAGRIGALLSEARSASADIRGELIGGARTAVLAHLRRHVGQAVPPNVIEGVAGIREWARRIRELRSMGWDIECIGSGPTATYRLTVDQLDEHLALSDDMIARVTAMTPKERVLEYLLHLSPWPATAQQLRQVAGVSGWHEIVRQLIDDGWMIRSREDDPMVPEGGYRLVRLAD